MKRYIFIYGGEFFNKGAQAMSFITISRIKNLFPDHEIIFVSDLDSRRNKQELEKYNFSICPDPFGRNNLFGENIIRKILKMQTRVSPKEVRKKLANADYMFDISGYALSSQFGEKYSKKYLKRLCEAQKRGIKTIILPQSIGPFDYENEDIVDYIKNTLQKVSIVMPREKQGEDLLKELGISNNVHRNADLVLTSKEKIQLNHIYKNKPERKQYEINDSSVMIIPNAMNFKHGSKEKILNLYSQTIETLLELNKTIYLVSHSAQDKEIIPLIKEKFSNTEEVKTILDDMTPDEFEYLVKQFDFTIASRFHAVVHSYKSNTPSLVLGWATKYIELAKLFKQEEYVFDVRQDFDNQQFLDRLTKMCEVHLKESEVISKQFEEIEELSDPFDYVFETFNNL